MRSWSHFELSSTSRFCCAAEKPLSHCLPALRRALSPYDLIETRIKISVKHEKVAKPYVVHKVLFQSPPSSGQFTASIAAARGAAEGRASGGHVQSAGYAASAGPRPPLLAEGRRPVLPLQARERHGCSRAAAGEAVQKLHRRWEPPVLQGRSG